MTAVLGEAEHTGSTTDVEAERAAYRDELVANRVLVPTSEPGLWGRSNAFESAALGVSRLVTDSGAALAAQRGHEAPEVLRFGPVMPRVVLEKADYLASFPDLVGSVHVFTGKDADHARLLAEVEAGEDWTRELVPSPVTLCSAECHPYWPTVSGSIPASGLRADVLGLCFRREPSADPARMQSFRQHEQVFVGSPEDALGHRDTWVERATALLTGLGLEVRAEVANDPFFGRAGRLLAAGQRQQALKIELVATVSSAEVATAISSSNLHQDHFGRSFGLELDGEPAHTACVGFGLERITLGLFRQHGMQAGSWPEAVRHQLGLS